MSNAAEHDLPIPENMITGQPEGITVPVTPEPEPTPIPANLLEDPAVKAAIEEARRQEKDKVYSRVETLEQEIARVKAEREEREAAEREAREAAEAEARRLAEEEMSVRELLQARESEWENRFTEIQQTVEQERAIFAMERQYQEVQAYRQQKIAENEDHLMPELLDMITGNTIEEIDRSVDFVREKTSAILGQMQAQQQHMRQQMRGAPVTAPPVGPMENDTTFKTLSAEDIAGMSMEEYSKMRPQLMAAVNGQVRQSGPYQR